jgi:hypothetical protein
MSAALIAFLVALGSSVWTYTKLQNRTGYGNNQAAIKGAAIVFIVALVVVFTLAKILIHN